VSKREGPATREVTPGETLGNPYNIGVRECCLLALDSVTFGYNKVKKHPRSAASNSSPLRQSSWEVVRVLGSGQHVPSKFSHVPNSLAARREDSRGETTGLKE
jgi:hypothetical protein